MFAVQFFFFCFADCVRRENEKPRQINCSRNSSFLHRLFHIACICFTDILIGDTDKGRKLAMAHKNVSLFVCLAKFHFAHISLQNYVMRGSRQSLPTLIEECSDTKMLCALAAMQFDAGQAYSNSKVLFQFVA